MKSTPMNLSNVNAYIRRKCGGRRGLASIGIMAGGFCVVVCLLGFVEWVQEQLGRGHPLRSTFLENIVWWSLVLFFLYFMHRITLISNPPLVAPGRGHLTVGLTYAAIVGGLGYHSALGLMEIMDVLDWRNYGSSESFRFLWMPPLSIQRQWWEALAMAAISVIAFLIARRQVLREQDPPA